MANWLLWQMKRTGSFHADARFMASYTGPRLEVPSPMNTKDRLSRPSASMVSAAPTPTAASQPNVPEKPRSPVCSSPMWMAPPRPPELPVVLASSSPKKVSRLVPIM